jgi:hypothetical protein
MCETWSLTSKEEHRLRVFENRVLRKIFGPKRDEVIGGWKKVDATYPTLLILLNFIILIILSEEYKLSNYGAPHYEWGRRETYKILVERSEGKRPIRRHTHGLEYNIKMDLRKTGFGDVDWIHLAQDRDQWQALVNTVMNLQI